MTESSRGVGGILKKLEKSVQDGDYYQAQQMYKTLYSRYTLKKNYTALEEMLRKGAILMLEKSQANSGTELALLLIEHYRKIDAKVNKETIEPLLSIFYAYTPAFPQQLRTFIKSAINWSSNTSNNNQGTPELHDAFAKFYDKEGCYGLAQTHYLRGTQAQAYGQMLVRWSALGYDSEKDLFIARAVFQYLCLSRLDYAKIVLMEFQKEVKLNTPLINFINFLLPIIEQKAALLFDTLRQSYTPSIKRDDTSNKYLDMIGKIYFGIEPPQGHGGLFQMLSNFFQSTTE